MQLDSPQIDTFQQTVWDYYRAHGRHMPWRDNPDPYWVLVSELMLQQTQIARVLPKFAAFVQRFPAVDNLARASLAEVLGAWSGLGYNRRAKFLHAAAQLIVEKFQGKIPDDKDALLTLPGVGQNTAGAILAYAFNQPTVFIETNIRTVYFYHFFPGRARVNDKELALCIAQTLDHQHPREWYWALMDYGTHLKQTVGNNISNSQHYTRQSKFEGSRRQVRGNMLKILLDGARTVAELDDALQHDERLLPVLDQLVREGFVYKMGKYYRLTDRPFQTRP